MCGEETTAPQRSSLPHGRNPGGGRRRESQPEAFRTGRLPKKAFTPTKHTQMESKTSETGRRGEQAAVDYLRRRGYEICALNWREGRYELDIVARTPGVLHFVEVKTRRAGSLTTPEEAITPAKVRALGNAARRYMAAYAVMEEVQFDLAAVTAYGDGSFDVRLIEQAMEYNW